MRQNPLILLAFFISMMLLFFSCKKSEKVVARVYDEYLYESDIHDIIPKNTSSKDSIGIAENYVNQWIKDAIILHTAKKSIHLNFEKRLRDYENSLIRYEYEQSHIEQMLDTNVLINEIQEYYAKYPGNFVLKDNIVKILYVKIKKTDKQLADIKKKLFKSNLSDEDMIEISKSIPTAINYYMDPNKWIAFQELQREVPIEAYNEKLFLQNNKNVSIEDEEYVYLVRIIDFKIKESLSPLNFEKDRIREIILNKRKVAIIEKMQEELNKQAELDDEIKIYPKVDQQ